MKLPNGNLVISTQKSIRVSVIIPCFNDGEFLEKAIASVQACPDPIYEIIIVNDDSTDPFTLEVLSRLRSRGYHIIDRKNQGPAAASRNTAIRAAVGNYILPLDSDNKIHPNYMYRSIEILDKFSDIAVVYSDHECFGEKTGISRVSDFCLSQLVTDNYIDNCAVFRKSAWEECGPYDEKIMPFYGREDYDLWLSIAKKGYKICYISELLFGYRK